MHALAGMVTANIKNYSTGCRPACQYNKAYAVTIDLPPISDGFTAVSPRYTSAMVAMAGGDLQADCHTVRFTRHTTNGGGLGVSIQPLLLSDGSAYTKTSS